MTDKENNKMKNITNTTATIDIGDWKLEASGQIGEFYDWRFEMNFKGVISTNDWKTNEYFSDQEELEEYMWEEVERLNKKYSSCVFTETIEEVENEDYEEDEE
jgi:hypothetical protein